MTPFSPLKTTKMPEKPIFSFVSICRILISLLGLIILILGIFSHFKSSWIRHCTTNQCGPLYKICEADVSPEKCPDINLEKYFIGVTVFTFLLSILGLLASLIKDMAEGVLRLIDIAYHGIAAILLLIGAVLYIISAEQVHTIYGLNSEYGFNFRRPEKLAAASLTIFQAILYGVTAFLITKS